MGRQDMEGDCTAMDIDQDHERPGQCFHENHAKSSSECEDVLRLKRYRRCQSR